MADYAKGAVTKGANICDLCTGTGIVALLLAAKTECAWITGIELQTKVAEMAQRSVELNHETSRIEILNADICCMEALKRDGQYDVVTANPPYMKSGLKNQNDVKLISRHEVACSFSDVAAAASRLLRSKGRFYLVHRPNRLVDIITILKQHRLEPKRIRMVHPFVDSEANMLLLEAVKDGGSQMIVEPPLIVYKAKNEYTDEIYHIYGRKRTPS